MRTIPREQRRLRSNPAGGGVTRATRKLAANTKIALFLQTAQREKVATLVGG